MKKFIIIFTFSVFAMSLGIVANPVITKHTGTANSHDKYTGTADSLVCIEYNYLNQSIKMNFKKASIYTKMVITTNGTLLTRSQIEHMSKYPCIFQITLDGNRKQHNKIKFVNDRNIDTYEQTLNNIMMIDRLIPNSFSFVRINFDRKTLVEFEDILNDINTLNKKKTKVILKRIWQVDNNTVDKSLVLDAMQRLFDNGFDVDYYTQGGLCFAERLNEVVVNFDGLVFKCTTIENFSKENSYGKLDTDTGEIKWNTNKLAYAAKDMTVEKCKTCQLYPSCYGPCNNIITGGNTECYIDSIDLTRAEYFMFMYKRNLLKSLS